MDQHHVPALQTTPLAEHHADSSYRATIGRLAIVLPAYNEEAIIAHTISDVLTKVPAFTSDFIVIPVNDGSHDRTGQIMDELASSYQAHLSVVHHASNRGYGSALRSGFERALSKGADAIFFMDADGQFDIGELGQFLPLLSKFDAVLGYRLNRRDGLLRNVNARAWRSLIRLMLGVNVNDLDCAFKLFRADFIRAAHLRAHGAMISAEMLALFNRANLQFVEVGVHHYPRTSGTPTGSNVRVILSAFRELILLRNSIVHNAISGLPDTRNARATDTAGRHVHERSPNTRQGLLRRLQPHYVALTVVMIMAIALRWFDLGKSSLWLDEIGEGHAARLSLGDMFDLVRFHAGATPFDYLAVKVVTAVLGYGTVATRLWAWVAGCLAVLMMYLAGALIFRSRLVGLVAAVLLCWSPYHISYSQEARFYSLLALMALVNLYFFERAMRSMTARAWGIFALVVALGFYSHYFLAIFLPIEGVYVALYWLGRWASSGRQWKMLVEGARQVGWAALSMVLGVALFVPWLLYATTAQLDTYKYPPLGALPFPFFKQVFIVLIGLASPAFGQARDTRTQLGVTALTLGLAGLGVVIAVFRRQFLVLPIAVLIAIAIPFAWAVDDHGHYFFSDRQVIFILPLIYLLAAAGGGYAIAAVARLVASSLSLDMGRHVPFVSRFKIGAVHRRTVMRLVIAALFVAFAISWAVGNVHALGTVYANTWRPKEDWRGAAAFVAAHSCSDSRYFSIIGANYDFGIGYYQPQLMPASQPLALASGHVEPSLLDTMQRATFRPHDWIVLFTNSGPEDQYLVAHGWSWQRFNGLQVYYQTLSCTT